jgi:hypothetical protein
MKTVDLANLIIETCLRQSLSSARSIGGRRSRSILGTLDLQDNRNNGANVPAFEVPITSYSLTMTSSCD